MLYGGGPACMVRQNNSTLECVVNGTDHECYDRWVWVIYRFIHYPITLQGTILVQYVCDSKGQFKRC